MQEKKSSYSDVLKAHGVTPEVWQAACDMQYLKESVFCHIFTAYEVFPDANKFELAELRERSARESWFAD